MKNILFPILLVLYEMVVYLSNDMYIPAVPQIMHDFNIDTFAAQLTLTSWFFGGVSLQLILGPLSDCYGRRPFVILGGISYIVSTAVCALTTNYSLFLVARFIEGSAQCSVVVAGYAAIHELYDTKKAITLIALMSSILLIGPGLGPLAGSLILKIGNWQDIFWFLTFCAIILIALLQYYMPESNPYTKAKNLNFVATVMSYLRIIGCYKFSINTLIFCFLFACFIIWLTAGPFAIIALPNHHNTTFGWIQLLIFAPFILGTRLVNPIMERVGVIQMVNLGLMVSLLGGILAWLLTLNPINLIGLVIGLMIFSFGSSFAFAPVSRLAMEASPEGMGAKMAIFSTAMTATGALASGLISSLHTNNLPTIGIFVCLLTFLAVVTNYLVKTSAIGV